MNSFTGQQFAEGLNSAHGLSLPHVPLTITGMAKKSGTPQTISFSPGTVCKVWVPIPSALIEKVDHLGTTTCKDHQHDYVRLHFVNPTTDEGKALTELLKHLIGLDESWLPMSAASPSSALAAQPAAMAFGWHPPHIHWPPITPPVILLPKCAQCIAINIALALAVAAAVAAIGPEIGAATAVSSLMAQFGISEAVAIAAVGGASGAVMARMMCKDVC